MKLKVPIDLDIKKKIGKIGTVIAIMKIVIVMN